MESYAELAGEGGWQFADDLNPDCVAALASTVASV
jgi:hypothetical protein